MIDSFLEIWAQSAYTTLGLFWMAFWAFGFGYLISALVQVFLTEQTMKNLMGTAGPKSILLATFFGFISSSCSFAALATTRSLFSKGAGLIPSLAFLLASKEQGRKQAKEGFKESKDSKDLSLRQHFFPFLIRLKWHVAM